MAVEALKTIVKYEWPTLFVMEVVLNHIKTTN